MHSYKYEHIFIIMQQESSSLTMTYHKWKKNIEVVVVKEAVEVMVEVTDAKSVMLIVNDL